MIMSKRATSFLWYDLKGLARFVCILKTIDVKI